MELNGLTQREVKFTYQGLSDCNKALNIELVLTQIEHLESPITLEHLGDICNTCPDIIALQVERLQRAKPRQVVQCPNLLKKRRARTMFQRRVERPPIRSRWM